MGVPLNHPFLFRNFPNKNHPAIGVPPIYGNPHIPTREDGLLGIFQAYGLHGTVNKTFNLPSKTNLGAENWKTPPGSKPELIYDCLVDQYQVGLPEGIHHFKLENPTIQFPGKETLAGQWGQLGEYPKNDPPIRVFSPRDPMPGGCPFAPCATAGPGCAYICTMWIHVWMDGWIAAGMHLYIQYTADTGYIDIESMFVMFSLPVSLSSYK